MSDHKVPFNRPYMTGRELAYIAEAHSCGHLAGDGPSPGVAMHGSNSRPVVARHYSPLMHRRAGNDGAASGHRGGDEVILPSYTFVSTANAFVLRGGVPVFVDIRPDTLNIDETRIVDAITREPRPSSPFTMPAWPARWTRS